MVYTITFDKLNKKMKVADIDNNLKRDLYNLLNSNIKYFTKSFEANIDIDEMNMTMKAVVKDVDYLWERKYNKLNEGVIFSFVHDIATDLDGVVWDEVFITHNQNDLKNDIFSYRPAKIDTTE